MAQPADIQSAGFKELMAGMESLKQSVTSQLKMESQQSTLPNQVSNSGDNNVTSKNKSPTIKVRYVVAAQFQVAITTDWKVCDGFTLQGIVLQMAAQMTDERDSASLKVQLEAFATIGNYHFIVSAEIPNIQSNQNLNIVFRLTMRLPAPPEEVCKALQSVSGGGKQYNPSALVDERLGAVLQRDRMAALLQLRVTKPAGQDSFRFNSLVLRFYGQINWRPKLENSEIGLELVDGDFIVVLAKDIYDNDAKLMITARLYGTFVVGKTNIEAVAGFSRDHLGENRIQFKLEVQPHMLSAKDFLNKLPISKDGKTASMNEGSTLTSLELPPGLQALATDLSQPNLKLVLAGSYSLTKSKLETLQFTAFAREVLVLCLGFLDNARLRDLMLHMEINMWTIVLSGKLDLGKFTAAVEIIFIKGRGLMVKGDLAPSSGCSLATLARMDIFNDKTKTTSMDIAKEAHSRSAGGGPPIDLSRGVRTRGNNLSFDLLVLKENVGKVNHDTKKQPNAGDDKPATENADKPVVPKEDGTDSSYQVKHVKFLSHFDLDWQIIQDKVTFEDLSICFDVREPRQENKRKMAGLLCATWRLSRVELFVYVLGKKEAQDTDFWAGLNIKESSNNTSAKALDIINDPKFAGSDSMITLPSKLPADVKAKPEDQKVTQGFEFDGRLMAHFSKHQKEDKSFVMKDVSLYIDLESPFTISGHKMIGSFFLDLHIKYPMIKEKRDFSCYIKGALQFEDDLYLSIEAKISMNAKKSEDQGDESQKPSRSTVRKPGKYLGKVSLKEDDIVCFVKASKSKPIEYTEDMNHESRLSMISENTQTEHETSFKSFLSSSYGSSTDDSIKSMVPKDNPLLQEKYQASMQFVAAMVLRRETMGEKSERKVRVIAATLTSTESWRIITDKLWIQDVGLCATVEWDDKRQRSISGVIQGTLVLKNTAALTTQVVYSQEILSVSAMMEMDLKNLFEGLDNDSGDEPDLAVAMREKVPSLKFDIEVKFKEMKMQGYTCEVRATPDFEFFSGFTLQAMWFKVVHNRSVTPRTTIMEVNSRLLLRNSVLLAIKGESSKDKIKLFWDAHKLSPAKIAKGIVEGGLDDTDGSGTKHELPSETGFGDWDKEEKEDFLSSGEILFVKDGSGRRFDSATLKVSLAKSTAENSWMLIDDYIKLKDFSLVITVGSETNRTKTVGVGLKAEFYLKDRATKDWPKGFDTVEMTVQRSTIEISLRPKTGRTVGDILWCLTSGFLDIPKDFDIPTFPILNVDLNWKTKEATLRGYFSSDKAAWKVPYIECVAKINQPHIRGTIKRQGIKSTRVSISGKLSFLNDLVTLDAEYVMLKGPLLIEGHDVEAWWDMIKNIWNVIKRVLDAYRAAGRVLGNAARALVRAAAGAASEFIAVGSAAIGFAIGGLIGGLSRGGRFLKRVLKWLFGGLLGGASWLSRKRSIIGLLRDLCKDTGHDTDEMIRGFLEGVAPHENEDAKGNAGDQSHDGPLRGVDGSTLTILPGGNEKLLKRLDIDDDSYIEISGAGICAGVEGELTEFILEYKFRRGVLAGGTHIVDANTSLNLEGIVQLMAHYESSVSESLTAKSSLPLLKVFEGGVAMVVGKRYRIPWQRPKKVRASSYEVSLAWTKTVDDIQTQKWHVQIKSKAEECFAPQDTILDVPATLPIGAEMIGYVFLKDPEGNIRHGIDDRSKIKISLQPSVQTKLSLLQNGCAIWAATALQEGTYALTVTVLDQELPKKEIKVSPISTLNDLVMSGPGFASGKVGESVSIAVDDKHGVLSDTDQLQAMIHQDGFLTHIELTGGKGPDGLTRYSGSYARPKWWYELRIYVNKKHVGASPYQLRCSEGDIPIDWKKWLFTTLRRRVAIGDTQTVLIDVYDQNGSSSRLAEDPLRGCQLRATLVDEDGEMTSDSILMGSLELLQGSDLAKYRVQNAAVAKVGKYKLSLAGGPVKGGSATITSLDGDTSGYITVVAQPVIKSLFVSGHGLQSGWEKSETNVTFMGFDQYGAEMRLMDAKIEWYLLTADGKSVLSHGTVSYDQGYFTYVRPKVQSEGTSEACFLHIALRIRDRTVEADGSPFELRTQSYFEDINFVQKSCWQKDRFISNELSWSTLYVFDQYGVLSRSPPALFVVQSPDYNIKSVSRRPNGTYRVSYITEKPKLLFSYHLGGTTIIDERLPGASRPVWAPCEYTIASPRAMGISSWERTIASFTCKSAIAMEDFSVLLYGVDDSSDIQHISTRIIRDPNRSNTYSVCAYLKQKGKFYLRPAYCRLPLTSEAKSHHVPILIEFDRFLIDTDNEDMLTACELEWATKPSNVRAYIDRVYMDAPTGAERVWSPFNFLTSVPYDQQLGVWPTELSFTITPFDGMHSYDGTNEGASHLPTDREAEWRLSRISVVYTGSPSIKRLTYGRRPDTPSKDATVSLLPDERIVRACIVTSLQGERVAGILLETNKEKKYEIPRGCYDGKWGFPDEWYRPDWCSGLKGFWGGVGESGGVDRLGIIWGK